jgi:N-acetylmuramoyl-L-alanine amidase
MSVSLICGRTAPRIRAASLLRVSTLSLSVCLAASVLASPAPLRSKSSYPASRSNSARNQFAHAETLRQELEGTPQRQRTRRNYARVADAYRAVYHDDPTSAKADAAVAAVAELLAEQGRLFAEPKLLQDSIGQYEFLRKQYPGSRLRVQALLIEAEILNHDLGDRDQAATKLREFIRSYPHSDLCPHARKELAALQSSSAPGKSSPQAKLVLKPSSKLRANPSPPTPASHTTIIADDSEPAATVTTRLPPPAPLPRASARILTTGGQEPSSQSLASNSGGDTPPSREGRQPMVTAIRHWSTPNSTRIAIDLDDEVRFQAGRVPNPDRVYFDLYGARLAPQLIGHPITIEDDDFLKDIRAAQYSAQVVRIVLDVSSVAEYSAFLLPNPYRLIIDIHGRKDAGKTTPPPSSALNAKPPAHTPARTPAPPKNSAASNPAPPRVTPPAPNSSTDDNGHETGVSRPPDDVSTTPPDDDPPPVNSKGGPQQLPISLAGSARNSSPKGNPKSAPVTRRKPSAASNAGMTDATLDDQPDTVRATRHPTTQPVVAEVAPHRDDATENSAGTLIVADDATTPAPPIKTSKKKRGRNFQPAPASTPPANEVEVHQAQPTADGERSLVRALGLKIGRIVIDPGHGGHDTGTIGADGIQEKDVVLDVALRLGKLLHQRLGANITFTRKDDTFVPLETRTAIANKAQADLFISIHANSSPDASARGVETYFLNFTSSPDALDVAARENAVSEKSIHELQDLVKKITLKDKLDESREFATDVEHSLYAGISDGDSTLKDRGVKKAPFVVLIGANMPSILSEISFVSNPEDARLLREPAYRERIAESLYAGIAKYISGLSSVRVAEIHPSSSSN